MPYFPMFVDLENKKVLIAGGGTVALRKAEKLLPYRAAIKLVAPRVEEGIKTMSGLEWEERPFEEKQLEGCAMVIAATDDHQLNHRIADMCRLRNIPVNVVDDRDWCSFIFPSVISRGELSIGISTGGASPTAAVWLRQQVEQLLPDELPEIIDYLSAMRGEVKARLGSERLRSELFRKMFSLCVEKGRGLDPREFENLVREIEDNE